MKKLVILIVLLAFFACNSQEKEKQEEKIGKQEETTIKPKEKWNVHREYDEEGNLIKYDSTYVWSYSNKFGDSLKVNLDSVMDSFKGYFEKSPFIFGEEFYYFPKIDSMLERDFFREDYYFENWIRDRAQFEDKMRQIDSLRNQFLKEQYPGLKESSKKNNKTI
jgi:Ni/Co efflux regulator RcnB